MGDESSHKKILKEGFMVKKGHIRHNWKTRWFILNPDYLHYYKSKGDIEAKGSIKLKGCSVISPDPEYTKKECVFRLIEILGREYLLQCSNEKERDEWVAVLGQTIRELAFLTKNNSLKISNRPTLNSPPPSPDMVRKSTNSPMLVIVQNRVTHHDLLTAMQDDEAGIALRNHKDGNEVFKMSFSGEDLISWLLTWAFVQTRDEGRVVAGELLEKAYLHPIGPSSKSSLERNAARKAFADNQYNLYRFAQLNLNNGWNWDFDMSEDSSDSDEDALPGNTIYEMKILDELKSTIVKQGFLVKKDRDKRNRRIRLLGSEVKVLTSEEDEPDVSCSKGCKNMIREHCFRITTKKGHKYVMQAPSEAEMDNWVKLLKKIISKYDEFL